MLFPISINLTELFKRFRHLSVSIVCSAIEQELRDQGEVVRLVVVDAQGQAIIDSSHTRSKLVYYVCSFFVPAIVQVFFFFGKRNRRHFQGSCRNFSVKFKDFLRSI